MSLTRKWHVHFGHQQDARKISAWMIGTTGVPVLVIPALPVGCSTSCQAVASDLQEEDYIVTLVYNISNVWYIYFDL